MPRVVATRQAGLTAHDLPVQLPAVDGFVAVKDCARIGDIMYLRPAGTVHWERFMVADCSGHTSTTEWMKRNNILVEVDYQTARRWNTIGKGIQIEVRTIVRRHYEYE